MDPAPERDLPRVWFLAPFAAIPLPPWVVGLGIAALVTAAYVAMELVFQALGRTPSGGDLGSRADLRPVVPVALLLGYIPAAVCYMIRAGARAWREIRPLVRNTDEELAALEEALPALTRRGFRLAGLAGALVWLVLLSILVPVPFLQIFHVQHWSPYNWFSFTTNLVLFAMFAQVIYASVRVTKGARLGEQLAWDIDLLDLRPLRPLVRQGLTGAFLWIVAISLVSLAFLGSPDKRGEDLLFQAGVLVVAFAGALAALANPLRGAHRLIAWKKRKELDALNAAIRGDRSALAGTGVEAQADKLSLADMVAYRNLVAAVHEWPVERGALLRILLYLGIPIGSWVGGALVERFVEALLE